MKQTHWSVWTERQCGWWAEDRVPSAGFLHSPKCCMQSILSRRDRFRTCTWREEASIYLESEAGTAHFTVCGSTLPDCHCPLPPSGLQSELLWKPKSALGSFLLPFLTVAAKLQCQHDWIWNQPWAHLCVSLWGSFQRLNWGRKTHLERWQHYHRVGKIAEKGR